MKKNSRPSWLATGNGSSRRNTERNNHQFSSSIGGDSSNYKSVNIGGK